jgi:hypothetical protein
MNIMNRITLNRAENAVDIAINSRTDRNISKAERLLNSIGKADIDHFQDHEAWRICGLCLKAIDNDIITIKQTPIKVMKEIEVMFLTKTLVKSFNADPSAMDREILSLSLHAKQHELFDLAKGVAEAAVTVDDWYDHIKPDSIAVLREVYPEINKALVNECRERLWGIVNCLNTEDGKNKAYHQESNLAIFVENFEVDMAAIKNETVYSAWNNQLESELAEKAFSSLESVLEAWSRSASTNAENTLQ